eukprot:COSAG01_NODE_1166_length_11442_cov_6.607511_1_plen_456_part_00
MCALVRSVQPLTPGEIAENVARLDALCPRKGTGAGDWLKPGSLLKDTAHPLLEWQSGVLNLPPTKLPQPKLRHESDNMSYDNMSSLGQSSVSLGHHFVGGWNETMALVRAKIRCAEPFSLLRFGDGEFYIYQNISIEDRATPTSVLSSLESIRNQANLTVDHGSTSNESTSQWFFRPAAMQGANRLSEMIREGFKVAADSLSRARNNSDPNKTVHLTYLGLPFYFCAEGYTNYLATERSTMGGGGDLDFVREYIDSIPGLKQLQPQLVYSWQFANWNYPAAVRLLHDLRRWEIPVVVVCADIVYGSNQTVPPWATTVLTVPMNGVPWLMANVAGIERAVNELAVSVDGHVFVFAAGPLSNALIPLMSVANPNNTYLDVGSALDLEIFGVKTRPFQSANNTTDWVDAGGALQDEQTCTETRWNISLSETTYVRPAPFSRSIRPTYVTPIHPAVVGL